MCLRFKYERIQSNGSQVMAICIFQNGGGGHVEFWIFASGSRSYIFAWLFYIYLHAKLGENRMKTDRVIKLYVIFRMPAAAILDFGGDFRLDLNLRLLEAMWLCFKFE